MYLHRKTGITLAEEWQLTPDPPNDRRPYISGQEPSGEFGEPGLRLQGEGEGAYIESTVTSEVRR